MNCLTRHSDFYDARYCTTLIHGDVNGPDFSAQVDEAWDAVGVPTTPTDFKQTGISAPDGVYRHFTINLRAGDTLTCSTSSWYGDADLYIRFGNYASTSAYNCRSWTSSSNEFCEVVATGTTTAYVAVYAYKEYAALALQCRITKPTAPPTPVCADYVNSKTTCEANRCVYTAAVTKGKNRSPASCTAPSAS
jgi:hypothetical protein